MPSRGTETPLRICPHCGSTYTRTIWHHLEECPAYRPRDPAEIAGDLDELGYPDIVGTTHDLVREAAVTLHRLARKDPRALEVALTIARKREGTAA